MRASREGGGHAGREEGMQGGGSEGCQMRSVAGMDGEDYRSCERHPLPPPHFPLHSSPLRSTQPTCGASPSPLMGEEWSAATRTDGCAFGTWAQESGAARWR